MTNNNEVEQFTWCGGGRGVQVSHHHWTGDEKMGGGGLCFVLPAKPVICALTSSGKHGASKWVLGSP